MECPGPLRLHLTRLIEKSLNQQSGHESNNQVDLQSFVHILTEEILSIGLLFCHQPKEYSRWVAENGEIISKCFSTYPEVFKLVALKRMTPLGVIDYWNDAKERNERVFQDITNHHLSLVVNGWGTVHLDSSALSYSSAAAEMGKKEWVRGINEWMESQILKYFRAGGLTIHLTDLLTLRA
jgi:hypothetical protein